MTWPSTLSDLVPDPVCRARGVSGSGGVGAWGEGPRGATSESAQLPGFVAGAGRRLVREMLLCPVGRSLQRSCRGSGSSSDPSEWLRIYVGIPTPTVIPHAGPWFRAGAHGPSPRVPSTAPGTCDHSGNVECMGADGLCLIMDLFLTQRTCRISPSQSLAPRFFQHKIQSPSRGQGVLPSAPRTRAEGVHPARTRAFSASGVAPTPVLGGSPAGSHALSALGLQRPVAARRPQSCRAGPSAPPWLLPP